MATSELKSKTIAVIDTGFFAPMAEHLAKSFGKTYYYCPRESGYMHSNDYRVGEGLENVERLYSFWDKIDEIDFFVFTDCVFVDWQEHLKKLGKLVWGAGKTAHLELDRFETRKWQKSVGLPTQTTEEFIGIDELRDNLKENQFVKIDEYRGDAETIRYYDKERSDQRFDDLKVKLGAYKDEMPFLVEDKIEGVELGYDGWTVDSQYPAFGLWGMEVKDRGYLGKISPYQQIPQGIRTVNEKLAEVFKKEKTRCTFSTEVRIDKKKRPFPIDITMRCPNPPYQLHLAMWENYAECIYYGAQGIMVQPKMKARYGAVAIMDSDFAINHWLALKIPKEIQDYVFVMNMCRVNGEVYSVPLYGLNEIGAVVGIGDTPQKAIDMCKKNAEMVHADQLDIDISALDEALEALKKTQDIGAIF
jgi:hypothetical protein